MNAFIPTGYLTVAASVDRVVELRQGEGGRPLLTEEQRATLRSWRDWLHQISRPRPKPVTPVPKVGDRGLFVARTLGKKYPHRLVEAEPRRPDVTPEEIEALIEKEPLFKEQQHEAGEVLRQLLYTGRVHWKIITEDGTLIAAPKQLSGGNQWHEALRSNRITFRAGILSVTGFPVVSRDSLEAAFNTDGTVKEERKRVALGPTVEGEDQPATRGRPVRWDWGGAVGHLLSVANTPDGLPDTQADIERLVAGWFSTTGGDEPAESAIREHVSTWCPDAARGLRSRAH